MALKFAFVPLLALAASGQQASPAPVLGSVETISAGRLQVKTAAGLLTLYTDSRSEIWKGTLAHDLRPLNAGDQVAVRYRRDAAGKPVIEKLWADIAEVSGVVGKVEGACFEVLPKPKADPKPACFSPDTAFSTSSKDLTAGQDVRVVGLDLRNGRIQAARVTIYNTDRSMDQ